MAGWEDGTATRPAVVTASAAAVGDDAQVVADPNLKAILDKLEARCAQPNMLTAPTIVAIGTSSAAATALTVGTAYMVYVTAPCWVEVGPDAVAAATTNTYIEPGMVFVWTPTADDTDDGIACISTVAGGSMYVQACQA